MNEIRCLAVRQPWAWAICTGLKDIENRSWTTKYRGRIAIVASASKAVVNDYVREAKPRRLSTSMFSFGAVIGIADVVDIEPLSPELESNRWAFGEYCWRMANGRVFPKPIPTKGMLNLYKADAALAEKIEAQINEASTPALDDDGRAWLEATLSSDEDRLASHIESYLTLGDWSNLGRLSTRALVADPGDGDARLDHGVAMHGEGRYAEALADFDQYVHENPDDAEGYELRANLYEVTGEVDKASADRVRAKELDPNSGNEDKSGVESKEEDS